MYMGSHYKVDIIGKYVDLHFDTSPITTIFFAKELCVVKFPSFMCQSSKFKWGVTDTLISYVSVMFRNVLTVLPLTVLNTNLKH